MPDNRSVTPRQPGIQRRRFVFCCNSVFARSVKLKISLMFAIFWRVTPCLFGGIHRLCLQKMLETKAVEGTVVPVQGTKANEAAVILSLAKNTGERSASRPDGVPRRQTPPLTLKDAGRASLAIWTRRGKSLEAAGNRTVIPRLSKLQCCCCTDCTVRRWGQNAGHLYLRQGAQFNPEGDRILRTKLVTSFAVPCSSLHFV